MWYDFLYDKKTETIGGSLCVFLCNQGEDSLPACLRRDTNTQTDAVHSHDICVQSAASAVALSGY